MSELIGRELSSMILSYGREVKEIVRGLREGVEFLNTMRSGEAMEVLARSIRADTRADNIRRDIILKVGTSIKEGYIREWVARLIRRLDLVAESSKEAARYLTIIPYLEIPVELRDVVESLSKLAAEGMDLVLDGLEALIEGDEERAAAHASRVEEIEERADDALVNGRRLLIKYGERMRNAALIVLIRDFIESIEKITDYAEDAADYIRTLALRLAA